MVSDVTTQPLRIVFFGTPDFAVPSLRRLIELDPARPLPHRVVAVVSQPDRPKGRGHHLAADADKGARSYALRSRCCSRSACRDEAFMERMAALGARPRRRGRLRQAAARIAAADPAAGHDQRPRVAAAALARRGAGPPRGHRRRRRSPASRSCGSSRSSTPGPTFKAVKRVHRAGRDERRGRAGPRRDRRRRSARSRSTRWRRDGRSETPQDDSLVTYAAKITKAEGAVDWGLAGRAHPQPRSRTAAVAARLRPHCGNAGAAAPHRADAGRQPGPPGNDRASGARSIRGRRRRRTRAQDHGRFSPRGGARCPRASSWPAGMSRPAPGSNADDRAGARRRFRGAAGGHLRYRRPAPRARPRAVAPARRPRSRPDRRDRAPERFAGRVPSIM